MTAGLMLMICYLMLMMGYLIPEEDGIVPEANFEIDFLLLVSGRV